MKGRAVFVCQQCGQPYSKWAGRCQECGTWNSIVEESPLETSRKKEGLSKKNSATAVLISELTHQESKRYSTDLKELDTVLGGGLVPGSVVLLGGEPGIGKSTLLLQAAEQYSLSGQRVLYVSGEESTSQISLRSNRLGINSDSLFVVTDSSLEVIESQVRELSPSVLILDSIQTVQSNELTGQAGSVGQLRACTNQIISLAKERQMSCFLVGHVTKEGSIAGPKVLEHMVDVVLYFEGMTSQSHRILRSIKNRFGATNEIGMFEITERGMKQVLNPSELFLSEKPESTPGSVITASIEGTRSLLVEIQALVTSSSLSLPRRTAIGLDPYRVSLLVAILEKRGGFRLFDQDIYVNVAGGLRLEEPATDLAVLASLISSYSGKSAEKGTFFFGEVGLGGEIRNVPRALDRLKEASRIGLSRGFVPAKVKKELENMKSLGLSLVPIEHVQELVEFL